ncbi:MAG: tetratricopeptide repeat protein [Armatimonadetes bacterium]|nr:tetratricopeptide repeat protein [Armatimonadota bacterium]
MIEHSEALIKEGKWDEAEAALQIFVDAHPVHPKGHALLAMCLGRKGDIPGASLHFQRAWALDPTDWGTGKNLIKCYEYHGKHSEALEVAHRIQDLRPSDQENIAAIARFKTALNILDPTY